MSADRSTEPMTVRASKETIRQIDALAAATDRSRNYIVNQALRQYIEASNWQIERIEEGIAAARAGRTRSADDVFADIAIRHGWKD